MPELKNRIWPYEPEWDWNKSHPPGTYVDVRYWRQIPGSNAGYWEMRRIRLA